MKRFRSASFFSSPEPARAPELRRRVVSHRAQRSRTTVASVVFAVGALLTGLVALGYSACGQDTVSAAEAVDFVLTPETGELALGEQISVAVMVGASDLANVDRAEVHLNYPEELLQVVEILKGPGGLDEELENTFNNSTGLLSFSARSLSEAKTAPFTLAIVVFEGVELSWGDAPIIYSTSAPRKTAATFKGEGITGALKKSLIHVEPTVPVKAGPTSVEYVRHTPHGGPAYGSHAGPLIVEADLGLDASGTEILIVQSLHDEDIELIIEEANEDKVLGNVGWLTLSGLPAVTQPGESANVEVHTDCGQVVAGTYTALIKISRYSPDEASEQPIWVEVSLICKGVVVVGLAPAEADIEPLPSHQNVDSDFSLYMNLESGVNPVSAVRAHLDFDPEALQVLGVENAGTLTIEAARTFDNGTGTVAFEVTTGGASPVGSISLAKVDFRALTPFEETCLSFSIEDERVTEAFNGLDPYTTLNLKHCFALVQNAPVEVQVGTPTDDDGSFLTKRVVEGRTFTATIVVAVDQDQQVDGAQAFINFDRNYLQVISATNTCVILAPFSSCELLNRVDNEAGQVDLAAHTLSVPAAGPFVLGQVVFEVRDDIDDELPLETLLELSFDSPRVTRVARNGSVVQGDHGNGLVTIGASTLLGQIAPQEPRKDAPDGDWWSMPLVVTLWQPGADPKIAEPLFTYDNVESDEQGAFAVRGVPEIGTFDVRVKHRKALSNLVRNVRMGQTVVDFGVLRDGDVDGDNDVDRDDIDAMEASFDKKSGDEGYNENANFNHDGFVDVLDASRLLANLTQEGD